MPQLAQLIDCIVNVVCHVSAVSPRVERKQGVSMLPQDRGVVVVLVARERRKSEEQFDSQPIGDSPLRRQNTTRRECTISMSANK